MGKFVQPQIIIVQLNVLEQNIISGEYAIIECELEGESPLVWKRQVIRHISWNGFYI